jgi:hypothetical protein
MRERCYSRPTSPGPAHPGASPGRLGRPGTSPGRLAGVSGSGRTGWWPGFFLCGSWMAGAPCSPSAASQAHRGRIAAVMAWPTAPSMSPGCPAAAMQPRWMRPTRVVLVHGLGKGSRLARMCTLHWPVGRCRCWISPHACPPRLRETRWQTVAWAIGRALGARSAARWWPGSVADERPRPGSASLALTGLGMGGGDQAGLVGEDDRLHAVAQVELGEDPRHVCLHRRVTERKRRCEFRVGHALAD